MKTLHRNLCEADISVHHRLSIFYYFLLDFDGEDSRAQISNRFAEVSGVPKTYQIFMKGLWLLDHQQFDVSITTTVTSDREGVCFRLTILC